ncbi:MAG: acyl-CoA synthetase FdrA [Bacteroidales bacterium]|nr:acyl-CoA synthetase FdrA [Bacteroidales bacterium]
MIKGIIKKGVYFDSVTLMIVSKDLNKIKGVSDSSVVMGTNENKSILKMADLYLKIFNDADDTDMLISIDADNDEAFNNAIKFIEDELKAIRNSSDDTSDFAPKSFESALKLMPEANLSLISVAGKYAVAEANKALGANINVMLFSDNISVEDELKMKQKAVEKGLLMMGPDCGTAIINGIPLAFANVCNKGNIGIVAASGTGLQEVSSIITNLGGGISQAIGTGGRDVKKEIGGIMFIEALKALEKDEQTKVITLISKPPHPEVLDKIASEIKQLKKPVVAIFIGADVKTIAASGAIPAVNLEQAAVISVAISENKDYKEALNKLNARQEKNKTLAKELAKNNSGKYIRGLYSGGTLCDEAQLLLKDTLGFTYSNTPLSADYQLSDIWKSKEHTIIDLGEDEFTAGRPHPMIDFSLRNRRVVDEAEDKETAVLLLDVVLGYGSNLNPEAELAPAFEKAKKTNPNLTIICSVTGTDEDPQNRAKVKQTLENTGAIVMNTNVEAVELAESIVSLLQ